MWKRYVWEREPKEKERRNMECKAPSVALSQVVFDQAFQYNLSIAARFIAITNGCLHFCGEISDDGKFQMLAEIPNFCG